MRIIVVVRSDLALAANRASSRPDTDNGGAGDKTFTMGLSATGVAPAQAFWCDWTLTNATALALQARIREEGGTVAETTLVPAGGTPASNRFAFFDTQIWTPAAILAKLALKIVAIPRGG